MDGKLYLVYNFKKKREKSWSGTPNSLSIAFSKFPNFREINVKFNLLESIKVFIARVWKRLFQWGDVDKLCSELVEKHTKKMKFKEADVLFTFSVCDTQKVAKTYVYQDLTTDYVARLYEDNNPLYKFALSRASKSLLVEHRQKQIEFYKSCAGILTMSEWLAKDLVQNTGIDAGKVHVVGGGSNIDITKIDHSQKKGNKFLFVGKNFDRKNGRLVIDSFKKLQKQVPDIELYIAGPASLPEDISITDGINFLGSRSYTDLLHYYNLCDFFVMPSKFEAYGLVFAEALAFGLPCIGKNIHAMPEIISDGVSGYLIENDDVTELSEKMHKMLNNKEMSEYVKSHKTDFINRFSWDTVVARIMSVIEKDN